MRKHLGPWAAVGAAAALLMSTLPAVAQPSEDESTESSHVTEVPDGLVYYGTDFIELEEIEWAGPADPINQPDAQPPTLEDLAKYDASAIEPQDVSIIRDCAQDTNYYRILYRWAYDSTLRVDCYHGYGIRDSNLTQPSGGMQGVCPGYRVGRVQYRWGGAGPLLWSVTRGPAESSICYYFDGSGPTYLNAVQIFGTIS